MKIIYIGTYAVKPGDNSIPLSSGSDSFSMKKYNLKNMAKSLPWGISVAKLQNAHYSKDALEENSQFLSQCVQQSTVTLKDLIYLLPGFKQEKDCNGNTSRNSNMNSKTVT